jgi:threonine dehydratase
MMPVPPPPAAIALPDVDAAHARILGVARQTPLERSDWLSALAGCDVWLKLECWQPTRSFKVRGALNAVASLDGAARARGLVTASAGNHGQALALAARAAGARATIFVPADAPATKKARIRALGASLDESAASYDDAEAAALRHAEAHGATFVHAFSDPAVVAGQATVALEVLAALPELAEVVVPVGGGGLIGGVGSVLAARAPACTVLGVQSTETPAMHAAFEAGGVVDVPVLPTVADGLAGCTDVASYERVRAVAESITLVSEYDILTAMRDLYRHEGVVAEGSGAVGVAAITSGALRLHGPAVVVITGGNIDAHRLAAILSME